MAGRLGGVLRALGLLSVLALIVAGAVIWWGWAQLQGFIDAVPSDVHEERIVTIPRGSGPLAVSRLLVEEGVVTDAERFAWFLRYRDAAGGLRAGEFRFFTDQRPDEVLEILLNAAEVTYPVTIPPGLRLAEMAERVEAAGRGSAARYLELAADPAFVGGRGLGIEPGPSSSRGS